MSPRQAKEPAMFKSTIAQVRTFKGDERGNVAMLFGISLLAVTMMVGVAFDFGRAAASKTKVAAAADAAALAAVKGMRLEGLSDAAAIALAKRVFAENMKLGSGKWTDINSVRVTLDRSTSSAVVDVDSSVKTTFAAVSGITSLGTPGSATAIFEARDIEVGLQLDLTGSMCSPCTKLQDLKVATKDLVDILIPATPTAQRVRVGFAPFSAGVNVGSYLRDVDGNRGSSKTCVYERRTPTNALTDAAPLGNDAYKVREDLTGSGIQNCPNAEIIPLTNDRDLLKTAVDTYNATSSTAGQLGASWAWNLVSPNWSDIWPAASRPTDYGTANTDKIVILMTDGVYNTIGGVKFGDTSSQAVIASQASVDLCANMKEAGVTVYTVGFDFNSIPQASARTRAINTLKACAGRKGNAHPEEFFYKADDGEGLRAAFNNIATDIMRMRLSN
jgi:Flp pilus assembly protein TadG